MNININPTRMTSVITTAGSREMFLIVVVWRVPKGCFAMTSDEVWRTDDGQQRACHPSPITCHNFTDCGLPLFQETLFVVSSPLCGHSSPS